MLKQINFIGSVSVQVMLLTPGEVYQEHYSGTSLSGSPTKTWIVNDIAFDTSPVNFWGSNTQSVSAKFFIMILAPIVGSVSFSIYSDEGSSAYLKIYIELIMSIV